MLMVGQSLKNVLKKEIHMLCKRKKNRQSFKREQVKWWEKKDKRRVILRYIIHTKVGGDQQQQTSASRISAGRVDSKQLIVTQKRESQSELYEQTPHSLIELDLHSPKPAITTAAVAANGTSSVSASNNEPTVPAQPAPKQSPVQLKAKDIQSNIDKFDQFMKNGGQLSKPKKNDDNKSSFAPKSQQQQQQPAATNTNSNPNKNSLKPSLNPSPIDSRRGSKQPSSNSSAAKDQHSASHTKFQQLTFRQPSILCTSNNELFSYPAQSSFLVMEDSSMVMMNLSFMKYELPKTLTTCTSGDEAFTKYILGIQQRQLYHFIILGINMQKGLDGNQVMLKIRAYEKDYSLPRTHLIALFNSVSSQIGGQTFSRDTYIFRGFDDAIEKPLTSQHVNSLLKERLNPQIVYSKPEDFLLKYRGFDKFTFLASDESMQGLLTLSSMTFEEGVAFEFAKSGQSLFDKFQSAFNGGRLYSFIFMSARQKDLQGNDVLKLIRDFEKDNHAEKTLIIAHTDLGPQGQKNPIIKELVEEGYSQVIDSSFTAEQLNKLIATIRAPK